MGIRKHMHQGLRLLNEHRVATGSAVMALFALTLVLLPRVVMPFVLGMLASPILILVTTVFLLQSMNQAEKARPDRAPRTLPFQGRSESEGPTMEYIMDTVVQGLAKAPAGDYPPYPVWNGNEYQGWLWTMENDKFDRSNTLDNWPPKVPGACKWWAHLQGSTLIVARDRALPEDSSHSGKGAAASQAHAQELEDALVVREIDLQGCRLSVLTEALQGKSRWLRKAPLELTHPDRSVFEGQQTVLLFAAGSAAKEQWFVALSAAISAEGGAGSSVHALYNTFCDYVREHALVDYPEADEDSQQDGLGSKGKGKSRKGQNRWLSRWLVRDGSSKKQGKEKAGSKKHEVNAPPHHLETKSLEPKKAAAAVQGPVLNPTERMDMLWMGKQLPPTPKFLRDAGRVDSKLSHAGPSSPAVLAATPTGRALFSQDGAFRQGSATEEHGTELRDLASPSQPKSAMKKSLLPPSAQSLPAMRLAANEEGHGNDEDDEEQGQESEEDASSEDESQATSPRSPFAHPQSTHQPEAGSKRPAHKGRKRKQRASAAAHLPSVPVEAAVNMLLARAGFDLLRSAAFKQRVHAHIQKKLDVLRIPEYIQSIEVIDVELGSMVPGISNLRALPCPTEALWPQTVFDLDYGGGLTVIIEAKLDVRDSASWDTLDKAIDRLGGTSAVNAAAASVNGSAAAAAAAAADVMSPGESDDDESTAGGAGADSEAHKQKKVGQLQRLRNFAAKRMRNLAEITAEHISKMHLQIQVDIHSLQGTVCAWVPPPPNDRLWFGFITAPELKAEVTPIVANDVRGRAIMMSYQASSVPKWVADKLQSAITKNLTLPSCADIPLPYLLPVDHPDAGSALPGFLRSLQGDAAEGHHATPDGKKTGREKRHKHASARADSAASSSIPDAEGPKAPVPVHKEEGKQHRGFLRWTRRGSRRSSEPAKATVDMEPVIQTEKDARRLSSAKRSAKHDQPAPASSKELLRDVPQAQDGAHQSPGVELSTFVTAAEHAREGKELQSFTSAHPDSEETEQTQASGPLAEDSLVLADRYGQATISTTLHQDGHVEAHSESTAAEDGSAASVAASVTGDSPGSTLSQEETSAPAEAGPALPAAAAASSPSQVPEMPSAGTQSYRPGDSEAVPISPVSSPRASAAPELPELSEGPAHGASEHGGGVAEDEEAADDLTLPEGRSPSAEERAPDDFSEGRGRGDTGAEGSSRQSHGAWKEIGGAMGKKYLEAFKNQKNITYSQGKKMATSLAGQAQEQMRKALAAREKAGKTDKRA